MKSLTSAPTVTSLYLPASVTQILAYSLPTREGFYL